MPNTLKSIPTIGREIKHDFRKYTFRSGPVFYWSSPTETVVHPPLKEATDLWLLLHEIAHAELGHTDYFYDIDLVRLEVEAWNHTINTLTPVYNLLLDPDFIEDSMDTYRMWLHRRSLCPTCSQSGIQERENTYSCINCRCSWRVNDARNCQLKRVRSS